MAIDTAEIENPDKIIGPSEGDIKRAEDPNRKPSRFESFLHDHPVLSGIAGLLGIGLTAEAAIAISNQTQPPAIVREVSSPESSEHSPLDNYGVYKGKIISKEGKEGEIVVVSVPTPKENINDMGSNKGILVNQDTDNQKDEILVYAVFKDDPAGNTEIVIQFPIRNVRDEKGEAFTSLSSSNFSARIDHESNTVTGSLIEAGFGRVMGGDFNIQSVGNGKKAALESIGQITGNQNPQDIERDLKGYDIALPSDSEEKEIPPSVLPPLDVKPIPPSSLKNPHRPEKV